MIKRLFLIVALSVTVSGWFMVPMAFIGPASSGFSTASIIQSGVTTGANYVVKRSTGKTIAEHAIAIINSEHAIAIINSKDIYQQTFAATYETSIAIILPKSKPVR